MTVVEAADVVPTSEQEAKPDPAPTGGQETRTDQLPTGGQLKEKAALPTRGQRKQKADCPPVGNHDPKVVLSFKLPTRRQKKVKANKQKPSQTLPTGGQDETEWIKSLLPTAKTGDWWEAPADDQGIKIKYRWRAGGQKHSYVFRRLGKRQIEILKGHSYERQVWLIADRIFGELKSKNRHDVATRLSPRPVLDRVASADH